ncbi:Methylmalonyl-CoA mutase [bacterium HR40]|nr:Methylmalonyl-CoA mutase [bacterium HR40]
MQETTGLASDAFAQAYALWQEAAQRTLDELGRAALASEDEDGIAIAVLHTRLGTRAEEGLPGSPPLLRGATASGQLATNGWEIRQLHGLPDPAANAEALAEDLSNGVRGIWLRLDLSGGDRLPRGTVVDGLAELRAALAPLDPTRHRLALDAAPWPRRLAALVLAWRRSVPALPSLSLGLDPVGSAAVGDIPAVADGLAELAELLPMLLGELPEARLLVASGLPWYESGATAAQELALTIATAIALLRSAEAHGLDPSAVAERLEFRLAADPDIFATAGKCRVVRRLWANVADAAGLRARPSLHAVTGRRTLSTLDPWTNLLRLVTATLGAVLGGADAVTTLPFDDPLGAPGRLSRRLARNTQHILALESRLQQPIDPLGGSFFLAQFADGLAAKAWSLVQRIEREGGIAAALESGLVQDTIAEAAAQRARRIATRRDILVGVSSFVDLDAPMPAATTPPPPHRRCRGPDVAAETVPVADLVRALCEGARFAPFEAHEPVLAVLPPQRLAAPFERLRACAEAWRQRHGDLPSLLLLCFGQPSAFLAPAAMARNLFEPGGFRVREQRVGNVAEAATAVRTHASALVAVCGLLDATDEERLPQALRSAGARWLCRIGASPVSGYDARPTETVDAPALLAHLWTLFGEKPA